MIRLILAFLLLPSVAFGFSQKPRTPPIVAPEGREIASIEVRQSPRLGIAFPLQNHYGLLRDVGIGTARIDAKWSLLEPQDDDWRAGLDVRCDSLIYWGVTPVISFVADACWATSKPSPETMNQVPDDLAEWQEFVAWVAARAPATEFMLLNEWTSAGNSNGGWPCTWPEAVDFVNASYEAIHAVRPDACVIMGAPAGNWSGYWMAAEAETHERLWYNGRMVDPSQVRANRPFLATLEQVLAVYREAEYDAVSVHQYGTLPLVDDRWAFFGSRWPRVVCTEAGGPSLDYVQGQTDLDKFAFAWHLNLSAFANDVPWTMWLKNVDTADQSPGNDQVPLMLQDGTKRPPWYAYKLLALCFDGAESCQQIAAGVWVLEDRTGARTIMALPGPGRVPFPSGFKPLQQINVTSVTKGIYRAGQSGDTVDRSLPVILSERVFIKE